MTQTFAKLTAGLLCLGASTAVVLYAKPELYWWVTKWHLAAFVSVLGGALIVMALEDVMGKNRP